MHFGSVIDVCSEVVESTVVPLGLCEPGIAVPGIEGGPPDVVGTFIAARGFGSTE